MNRLLLFGFVVAIIINVMFVWHTDLLISNPDTSYFTNGFVKTNPIQTYHTWMYANFIAMTYMLSAFIFVNDTRRVEQ